MRFLSLTDICAIHEYYYFIERIGDHRDYFFPIQYILYVINILDVIIYRNLKYY